MNKFLVPALFVITLSLAIPTSAYAYLDPGTGSVILQLLVAGFLGTIFTLKMWWRSTLSFLGRLFGKNESDHSAGV